MGNSDGAYYAETTIKKLDLNGKIKFLDDWVRLITKKSAGDVLYAIIVGWGGGWHGSGRFKGGTKSRMHEEYFYIT